MYYRSRVVLVGELTEVSTAKLINHYYDHTAAWDYKLEYPLAAATRCSSREPSAGVNSRRSMHQHQLGINSYSSGTSNGRNSRGRNAVTPCLIGLRPRNIHKCSKVSRFSTVVFSL
jgi:hypothetical protein